MNDADSPAGAPHDTPAARAEDIAYTINHSLYCTLTDFLNPPINAATDGWLRWLIPGCGHDHSHDEPHDHHHHPHDHAHDHAHHHPVGETRWEKTRAALRRSFSRERFVQYAKGEFIGDFGAVPLTIGMQRLCPGAMGGIRALAEPVMRPVFRYGTEASSKRWAHAGHVDTDSQAYRDHVQAVYEYEMSHFPQAVVWTAFSLGLNVAYQMYADKSALPALHKLALKSTSVLSGVVVTAGVVVAARVGAPHSMRRFDQWTGAHVILPATRTIGRAFGVDAPSVERMAEKQAQMEGKPWAQRRKEDHPPRGR